VTLPSELVRRHVQETEDRRWEASLDQYCALYETLLLDIAYKR